MKLTWNYEDKTYMAEFLDLAFLVEHERSGWAWEVTHIQGSGGTMPASDEGLPSLLMACRSAETWLKGEAQTIANRFLGWFDNPHESEPAYDPKDNPLYYCPLCAETVRRDNVKTMSLMVRGDVKSYFYRAHKSCYEKAEPERITHLDEQFIEVILELNATEES